MTKIRENIDCVTPSKKGVALDTLAQLDENTPEARGKNALQTLTNRAKYKYFTNEIIYPLIDYTNPLEKSGIRPNEQRNKTYWNTFHCVRLLQQDTEGAIRSKYCKNRICIVCNRIRTAIQINGYLPTIKKWKEISFLTLSRPTVSFAELPGEIQLRKDIFVNVWRRVKYKYPKTQMIRKLEITWNWKTKKYHPHFHVLLNDYEASNYFLNEWLIDCPTALLNKGNMDIKGNLNSVMELFKYMTKMWKTEKAISNTDEKIVLPYPPEIMDNILAIMYKKKVIQPYGKIKMVDDDFDNDQATVLLNEIRDTSSLWVWEQDCKTWVDFETGELRT